MFRIASEDALSSAFRWRDRNVLELPSDVEYPLGVRGYHAWQHPSGGRVYLVFALGNGEPTGIAFDVSKDGDKAVMHICDWCNAPGSGDTVGMLRATVSAKKKIGVYACADLSCARKLEDDADRNGRSALAAIEQVVSKMARFAEEGLGMDLSGDAFWRQRSLRAAR